MYTVGDKVRVVAKKNGHMWEIGDIVTIKGSVLEDDDFVDYWGYNETDPNSWHFSGEEVEPLEEPSVTFDEFWSTLFDQSCKEDEPNLRKTLAFNNLHKAITENRYSFLHLATAEGSAFWKYVFDRLEYMSKLSNMEINDD